MTRIIKNVEDMDQNIKECLVCNLVCNSTTTINTRTFSWDLRPRSKDLAKGHVREHVILEVDLCDGCFEQNIHTTLIGWDWWDAVDGLI